MTTTLAGDRTVAFLDEARAAVDAAAVWAAFERYLAPLELCGLSCLLGIPRATPVRGVVPEGDGIRYHGRLVSDAFERTMRAEPPFRDTAVMADYCRATVAPTGWRCDALDPALPDDRRLLYACSFDFGVSDGFIVPLHAPDGRTFGNVVMLGATRGRGPRPGLPAPEVVAASHMTHALLGARPSAAPPRLAPREAECLQWVAAGMGTKQLAHRMGIAEGTATEYIAGACRKLGARNRAEAVARAVMGGLVTL